MKETFRIGSIAGVRVGVNWSVLVIFALITLGLAGGRFPLLFPDLDAAVYVVAGLAAGVIFLLSLLAHEVSHAVVAERHGVEVEGITLWMFGGVAKMTGEARTPSAELKISGVGPLVSVLLAGAFGLVAAGLNAAEVPGIVVDVFVWLALINGILAVFNLVPAAPLDGGRILRAVLWRRRGDRTSAAITASKAGRVFGWVLVGLGLLQLLAIPGLGGIWLMLIGWFLTNAAQAEEQHALMTSALGDVTVGDLMSPEPTAAPDDISVAELLDDYIFPNRYSTFPLVDDRGRPTGLVTLRRVKSVPTDERAQTPARQIACDLDDVPVVEPGDPVTELLPRLRGCSDGRALVVEDGRLVGIVSPTDVMRRLEVADLRDDRDLQRV